MKNYIKVLILTVFLALPVLVLAQSNDQTAPGKAVFEQLQKKEITCNELNDEQFGILGEYFMEQMMGSNHQPMNTLMTNMMGQGGVTDMHLAMGKRMSACEPQAPLPEQMQFMMNMMSGMMGGGMMGSNQGWGSSQNMMGGGMMGNMMSGYSYGAKNNLGSSKYNNMMGAFGFPWMATWGWFGPFLMIAFWVLVIWGIVALVRGKSGSGGHGCCHNHQDHENKDKK